MTYLYQKRGIWYLGWPDTSGRRRQHSLRTRDHQMAQVLEDMDEVICYVKNDHLGFVIPYTLNGDQRHYYADFLVRLDDGHGSEDPLSLIVEVTGARGEEKEAKVATARTLGVSAVNNAGTWGRWAFIEVTDPWDAKSAVCRALRDPGDE